MTSPPSTTRFWPVTTRDNGLRNSRAASANSAGVVGHVRLDGPCLARMGVGDGLGAFPAPVVVDDDAASMGEHRFGDLFAKTTRSTRHQDKLLIDIHVQRIIAHDVALPPPM